MADKTPVRVVFNSSNVATGMAEFQSGETVGVANGGTGLSSIGSAGQVLKVNAAGNALVFAGEGDLSIQNLVAPSNADLTLTTSGTGSIVLNDLTIADNSISTNRSNDDLQINASGTGTVILENLKIGTSGSTVTTILDEDNMSSDSATSLATQQSIKAYVDSEVGAVSTTAISQLNSNVTVADSGSGTITVTVDASTIGTFTSSGLQLGGSGARVTTVLDEDGFDSNSNTSLATQQSIKAYVDAQITAEDLDFQADSGGALSIDLDSETFTFTGGTGIDTSGSGNAVTFAIDSTVATLTGSQTLTNKTISSPTIETPTITGATTIGEITTNLITSNGSNADVSIQPSGTGDVLISGIRINGTTLDSSDSSTININENVIVDGTLTVTGALDFSEANLSNVGNIGADQIFGDGDTNTSITFSGSDVITIATGGATAATFNADQTTTFSGAGTFAGIVTATSVTANDFTSNGSNADITIAPQGTGDINLTAGADVNIPSGIGLTFGDDAEKIEGDGTDLTISGNNINLTAVADVNIPSGVGLTFATAEKIESDGTDLTITVGSNGDINIPANIGLTFGNDGEKIEGDGTDLTITGNLINLTAATAVVVPSGIPLRFVDDNEKITSDGTDLTINSGADINLTATADVNIPANVGITFGNDAEKIEGDGTDLTISGNNIKLTAATDVIIPTNVGLHFTDANEKIESDGSKLTITSGGTAFALPTSDGDAGDFLKTDGAGTLSFGSAVTAASDDTRAVVKTNKSVGTSARTIDFFQASGTDAAFYFMALNDLTNDHTSASVFTVCHNDSDAFISGPRGGSSGTANTLPSTEADISSNQVRVKIVAPSADSKISYYKIPLSRANTANATSGVTVTTANTDVDSATESIDTFAHASFRAAKYFIIIDDNAKTETGVTEALVVHDGTDAFVAQYGTINTGNNDMITLTAAIDGSNVVLSAAGLTSNLSLKIHKTLLSDSMTAVSNSNQKIIGATTISSSATAFDSFDMDDNNAALYYIVGKNASEGEFSVQEVYMTGAPGEAGVSAGPFVSTKSTTQLTFTAAYLADEDNSVGLSIASTSGASTVVNAYRINALAE
tara:strand:- start:10638 stop:13904 length:3267 start_codon:yes stop_codon:yes gene_type:complete